MDNGDIIYYKTESDMPINKCKSSFTIYLDFYYTINILLFIILIFIFMMIFIIVISAILRLIETAYNYYLKKYINIILNYQIQYVEEQKLTPEKMV
jgi:hypothetical protein